MTARVGTMSVDGTPISEADMARIHAEEELHSEQQRKAVMVVASAAHDVEDCRTLLAMLGLDDATVVAARAEQQVAVAARPEASVDVAAPKRSRKRRAA